MSKLQRPSFVFMNGSLTRWDDANLHVASEAVIRGISVFEGIKGYWSFDDRVFSLLALRDHFERLSQSAMMLHLPFNLSFEKFEAACNKLTNSILVSNRDLWLRPTVLPVEGNWGLDTVTDLVITAYTQDMVRPDALEVGISSWQRPGDASQPARIKSAANYQVSRNARIDGRRHGFGEMVLLNQWGRVAEGTGSAILIARNGQVITPPVYEGCLESITVKITERLCRDLGIDFIYRPIEKSELFVADEICFAGTLLELAPVKRLEFKEFALPGKIFERISDGFWDTVRGKRSVNGIELSPISKE